MKKDLAIVIVFLHPSLEYKGPHQLNHFTGLYFETHRHIIDRTGPPIDQRQDILLFRVKFCLGIFYKVQGPRPANVLNGGREQARKHNCAFAQSFFTTLDFLVDFFFEFFELFFSEFFSIATESDHRFVFCLEWRPLAILQIKKIIV